jgi:hypothetical protein
VALAIWIFVKLDMGDILQKSVMKIQILLNWTKISDTLCQNLSLFHIVGSNIVQQWTEHTAVIPWHSFQYLLLGLGLQ